MIYPVICTDPPWKSNDKLGKRGAAAKYKCMSIAQMIALPRPRAASNAVMFMWRLSSMGEEAYALMRAWGFKPHSEIVWEKKTKHGKDAFGQGRIVRGAHETCIIGVRGKKPPVKLLNIRSRFSAPVGIHSAKPEKFYEIVESLFDGPYVEMFSRRRRDGWDCFGDQLDLDGH